MPRLILFNTLVALVAALSLVSVARALAPRRIRDRRAISLVALALAVLDVALEWWARRHAPVGGGAFRPALTFFRVNVFTLVACGLLYGPSRLLLAVSEQLARWFRRDHAALDPARREALVQAGTAVITLSATAVMYRGAWKGTRELRVREIEVTVPGLPRALEGLTLTQLTDIHVGVFTGVREFSRVIDRTHSLRSDLVVLTGDLLDNNPAHVPDAMALFARLRAPLGRYAILGNHDYYTGWREVADGLARASIPLLVNDAVLIPGGARADEGLVLAGVDDVWAPRYGRRGPDLARALARMPMDAPRVLLAHNPRVFDSTAGRVALQLSGHTHGGQIDPAGVMDLALKYCSGRYERDGSVLFVSNGLGFTGPPVRVEAPLEIVRVGLTGRATRTPRV